MKDISQLPSASSELLDESDPLDPPEDLDSRKVLLAKRLEAQGKTAICVGRALVTIERCELETDLPEPIAMGWGVLKISVYSDPDVSGVERPEILYIDGGKYGVAKLVYENATCARELNVHS